MALPPREITLVLRPKVADGSQSRAGVPSPETPSTPDCTDCTDSTPSSAPIHTPPPSRATPNGFPLVGMDPVIAAALQQVHTCPHAAALAAAMQQTINADDQRRLRRRLWKQYSVLHDTFGPWALRGCCGSSSSSNDDGAASGSYSVTASGSGSDIESDTDSAAEADNACARWVRAQARAQLGLPEPVVEQQAAEAPETEPAADPHEELMKNFIRTVAGSWWY